MLTLQGDTLTNNYNLWITLFSIGKILKLVGDTSQPWSIFIILFPLDLMIFKPLLGQQTRNYNSLTNWFFIDELFGYIILKCIYVPLVWINKQWLTHSCKSVSINGDYFGFMNTNGGGGGYSQLFLNELDELFLSTVFF